MNCVTSVASRALISLTRDFPPTTAAPQRERTQGDDVRARGRSSSLSFNAVAALEEIVDPFEKPLVEQNSRFMACEARRHFARDFLKLGRRICGFEIEKTDATRESCQPLFSSATMVLVNVGSARLVAIFSISAICVAKCGFKRRLEMANLDFIERRHGKAAIPFNRKRVRGGFGARPGRRLATGSYHAVNNTRISACVTLYYVHFGLGRRCRNFAKRRAGFDTGPSSGGSFRSRASWLGSQDGRGGLPGEVARGPNPENCGPGGLGG